MKMMRNRVTDFGVLIDFETRNAGIESRYLRNVVIFPLALLLLELERDTADGAPLDTFHKMRRETRYFVAEAL
jgi:hypothetical protein